MDGDWNVISAKPKKKVNKPKDEDKPSYGGKGAHGKLIAGPIKNGQMSQAPKQN